MYLFLIQFFDTIGDWFILFLHEKPLIGPVLLLLIEEAGIPLPIPGDIFISYVGYRVSRHAAPYPLAFVSLFIAILIGSSILYFLSYYWGRILLTKFGKYIHLNEKKLEYIEEKFRKYGFFVIVIGRHLPGFRIPVTVFSGLSRVNYFTFLLSEIISIFFWIAFFLQLGEKLGVRTLRLFHNNYSFILLLFIPIIFIIVTIMFCKFIPEKKEKKIAN